MAITKYPVEYELKPKHIEAGARWLTLVLKNVSEETLAGLDVKLNSLDTYAIQVSGTGSNYIPTLEPDEKEALPFQVLATGNGSVYISMDGLQNGVPFHWESPGLPIIVGQEVAELVSLFALTEPYPLLGEQIRCEATVRSLAESEGLRLEFLVETVDGKFEGLEDMKTEALGVGETERYVTTLMPQETGLHTVHVYLYDGVKRIGHEMDRVEVRDVSIREGSEEAKA
jgi:hypothetical protein